MIFKEGTPSKKGLYLMSRSGNTVRLVRVRGIGEGEVINDPGVYGSKIYEFMSITKGEWVRFEPKDATWSPRIRHAVGFKPEPQEPEAPKAPQIIVELTQAQGLDEDLTRRIKAAGACWKVDMLEGLRKAFEDDYKKATGATKVTWNGGEPEAKTVAFAWGMYKKASRVR